MTDSEQALAEIERAVARLLPELSDRLTRHGLGEIEITSGEVRLRVAGGSAPKAETSSAAASPSAARPDASAPSPTFTAEPAPLAAGAPPSASVASSNDGVSSPAVGFFVYGEGLGPGMAVEKGDALGYVEMLGVRHDVRAPRRGTVRNLVAESGEPVEYGQVVLELAPAEAER